MKRSPVLYFLIKCFNHQVPWCLAGFAINYMDILYNPLECESGGPGSRSQSYTNVSFAKILLSLATSVGW